MNSSVYRVSLDIHKAESQVVLDMKKRDTDSRKIQINLTENGKPYRLTSDCLANFYAKKADGNIIYNGCSVSAKDNLITYEVTEQTTSAVGRADCEIRLFDTEGRILTSPRFTILVHGTVYNEGDIIDSSSEVDAFQKLINNADVLNCFGVNYAGTLPTFKGKHSSKEITLIDLDNVVTRDNALRVEFDNKLAQHKNEVPTHENKSVLDNLGENEDGDLTYKGKVVGGTAEKPLVLIEAVVDYATTAIQTNFSNGIAVESPLPNNARVKKVEIPDVVNGTDEYIQLEDMATKDPVGFNAPYFVMYPKNATGSYSTVVALVIFLGVTNGFYDAATNYTFIDKTIKIYYEIEE